MFANPNFLTVLLFVIGTALQLGDVHSKQVGYVCWVVTLAMAAYSVIRWWEWPTHFRRTLDGFRIMRFGGRIPLPDAARIAYEEARASGSIWAEAAERLGNSNTPEGILDYVAMHFATDTNLWGKRPPSTRLELIDPKHATYGTFAGGAKELRLRDKAKTVFTDMVVATKDLRTVVNEFRDGLKGDTQI
jgi:hypothetical protein